MSEHTEIVARQGGAVGVKPMRVGGVMRLTVVAESGTGSLYLHPDECAKLAAALAPAPPVAAGMVALTADDLMRRYDLAETLMGLAAECRETAYGRPIQSDRPMYEPGLEGKKAGLVGFVVAVDGIDFAVSIAALAAAPAGDETGGDEG